MCEITESESMERRLDSLAAENRRLKAHITELARRFEPVADESDALQAEVDRLRDSDAMLRFEAERLRSEAAMLGRRFDAACEVAEQFKAERDAALLGLGRVLSGADAVEPTDGELMACAREFLGPDAAPAGDGDS